MLEGEEHSKNVFTKFTPAPFSRWLSSQFCEAGNVKSIPALVSVGTSVLLGWLVENVSYQLESLHHVYLQLLCLSSKFASAVPFW